jgi:sugar phosphate isomerase/epimerase
MATKRASNKPTNGMKTSGFSQLNRRQFLGIASAVGAGMLFELAPGTAAESRKKIPVGLQLYSLRVECQKDLPGTLVQVSKIGYKGVEFAGYHNRTAKELRKMLDDNGLVAEGTHTPFESIKADILKETIEFNYTIGNKFLIVPWMNETKSKQEWMDRVKLFNEVAEKLKPEGMSVGYHAHAHDFHKIDDVSAWDLFFGNTNKEVIMQLDTSNCRDGGAEPVEVLKKYPGRARTIHIKAHGAGPEGVIPQGDVNWKEVFAYCEGKGKTEWYVVEHETSKNPLDAVKRTFESLKDLGKV